MLDRELCEDALDEDSELTDELDTELTLLDDRLDKLERLDADELLSEDRLDTLLLDKLETELLDSELTDETELLDSEDKLDSDDEDRELSDDALDEDSDDALLDDRDEREETLDDDDSTMSAVVSIAIANRFAPFVCSVPVFVDQRPLTVYVPAASFAVVHAKTTAFPWSLALECVRVIVELSTPLIEIAYTPLPPAVVCSVSRSMMAIMCASWSRLIVPDKPEMSTSEADVVLPDEIAASIESIDLVVPASRPNATWL